MEKWIRGDRETHRGVEETHKVGGWRNAQGGRRRNAQFLLHTDTHTDTQTAHTRIHDFKWLTDTWSE